MQVLAQPKPEPLKQYLVCISVVDDAPAKQVVYAATALFTVTAASMEDKYKSNVYLSKLHDETQSESLGDLRALPDRKGKNVAAQFKRYARKYRNDDFPICYVTLRKEKILAWRNEVEAKTPWQSYDFKSLQHWRPTVGSYLTVEAWPDK